MRRQRQLCIRDSKPAAAAAPADRGNTAAKERPRRLTYNERRELEQLGRDIESLEQEKAAIVEALSGAPLSVEEITEKSKRLPLLQAELDEKEMRWLELSDLTS